VVSTFPAGESHGEAQFHEESWQESGWAWCEKCVLSGDDLADIILPTQAIGPMTACAVTLRRICERHLQALYSVAATRELERAAAITLPQHTLMVRAGRAVAQLAQALAPHAQCIWLACGPGNNGGDGLVAARHLHQWAQAAGGHCEVVVTLHAGATLPPDATQALDDARSAGVRFAEEPPEKWDLGIDALLGIGVTRAPEGQLAEWIDLLQRSPAPCLCVDLPSGLDADTGHWQTNHGGSGAVPPAGPRHTLSLLTLKPGLFTAQGRDQAGQVWFDDLRCAAPSDIPVAAWLAGRDPQAATAVPRAHASHKGSRADVVVIGGQDLSLNGAGMTGAAVLAARAALRGGAGRVLVGLLADDSAAVRWDPQAPELMFRRTGLLLERNALSQSVVVCGCGGGDAVARVLPDVIAGAWRLVLDADALNAIARDASLQAQLHRRGERGAFTVITPHPLEAARLLGGSTAEVMLDRLQAGRVLAERFGAVCVLKGSGTVIAAPGATPRINPTGNAALATAGTGDVLAGLVGAALAGPDDLSPTTLQDRVAAAVFQHGWLADQWVSTSPQALSADRLASRVQLVV
jgi:hydroxyethylthiazole kinase-like uncharacterized protein yjeF